MTAAAAIMEEIQASGCNGAACHAQMYTMGTMLRHGSAAQKARYLPQIASGELRLQAFGVTEPTSGTDTLISAHDGACAKATTTTSSTARRSGPRAPSIPICCCCSPAPRRREQAKKRTDGLSVFLVDMRLAQGAPASASIRSAP